jgi:hypothetical protein
MDIKQELADLKMAQDVLLKRIAELETEVNKPMDCYFGEGWIIDDTGKPMSTAKASTDTDYTQIRNKEVAEQVAPLVQIQRALVNFKCEHDPMFDRTAVIVVYTIEWSKYAHEYIIAKSESLCSLSAVWFSSQELAQSALEMLTRRKLI